MAIGNPYPLYLCYAISLYIHMTKETMGTSAV